MSVRPFGRLCSTTHPDWGQLAQGTDPFAPPRRLVESTADPFHPTLDLIALSSEHRGVLVLVLAVMTCGSPGEGDRLGLTRP